MIVGIALIVALITMAAESRRSIVNEQALRAGGATEPPGDVYQTMAWAYPSLFLALAAEGLLAGAQVPGIAVTGAMIFILAKGLKYWAIVSLGPRWTFRVLVLPHTPLVSRGPYTLLRHPNYVAVVGEIIGFALLVGAPVVGVVAVVGFGALLRRRIQVEERALGL